VTDQLSLFGEVDAGTTDAERDAIVADFMSTRTDIEIAPDALRARPCICEHPLVFASELGEGHCGLCGREPR
jgi:hypothetical protein